ncbi:hypothetical protein [Altererythrobacter sp. MTPC7]|uniref:hypothetical protein n=1 Tax=Altererythrobacter sp. MTPC7 TaxID=3056567 RepID=UPI0036F30434
MNPKYWLSFVAIIALAAMLIAGENSTVSTIAASDDVSFTSSKKVSADASARAQDPDSRTGRLNYRQPDTSNALLDDFYGPDEDGGFADDRFRDRADTALEDSQNDPVPGRRTTAPTSSRSTQTSPRPTSSARAQSPPSPSGFRSNGPPAEPIILKSPPPALLDL